MYTVLCRSVLLLAYLYYLFYMVVFFSPKKETIVPRSIHQLVQQFKGVYIVGLSSLLSESLGIKLREIGINVLFSNIIIPIVCAHLEEKKHVVCHVLIYFFSASITNNIIFSLVLA